MPVFGAINTVPASTRGLDSKGRPTADQHAPMSNPYPITPVIIPFLLSDTPTPGQAASAHCRLMTCIVDWSEPFLWQAPDPCCNAYKIINLYSVIVQHERGLNDQAFGARDDITSNIISNTKSTSLNCWDYFSVAGHFLLP